jgi:hypothetical protein
MKIFVAFIASIIIRSKKIQVILDYIQPAQRLKLILDQLKVTFD